jgi:DNA-binding response OmpR family regulator
MARIIVIDDDPDILNITRASFEIAGHEVMGVADSRVATDQLFAYQPDAVVLDLMMPHLSGWDLLEIIRGSEPRSSRVPIVIISALADVDNRVKGLRQGADDYLSKPFDPKELIVRVEVLIQRREESSGGLHGSLADNPLVEVIHGLEQNRKSGILEVATQYDHGEIHFGGGKIVKSEYLGFEASDALLELLQLKHGRFAFLSQEMNSSNVAEEHSPTAIGMEWAWLLDELALREQFLPDPDTSLNCSHQSPRPPSNFSSIPIGRIAEVLQARPGKSLRYVLAQGLAAPLRVKTGLAWLIEQGVVARLDQQKESLPAAD